MGEKEITLNQIAVMIEGVRGDVKAVAEGHQVIRREMREMKEEIIGNISFVDGKVEHLGREFREMKRDLAEVKGKVDKMDSTLTEVKETLDEHVKLPAHA